MARYAKNYKRSTSLKHGHYGNIHAPKKTRSRKYHTSTKCRSSHRKLFKATPKRKATYNYTPHTPMKPIFYKPIHNGVFYPNEFFPTETSWHRYLVNPEVYMENFWAEWERKNMPQNDTSNDTVFGIVVIGVVLIVSWIISMC